MTSTVHSLRVSTVMLLAISGCGHDTVPQPPEPASGQTTQQLATGALVKPVIASSWKTLFKPSIGGTYLNDHTVFKGTDGRWHVYGISGDGGIPPVQHEISLANGYSAALCGPSSDPTKCATYTEEAPIAAYAQSSCDASSMPGGCDPNTDPARTDKLFAWAPHAVIGDDGVTYMFYASGYIGDPTVKGMKGNSLAVLTSKDPNYSPDSWTARLGVPIAGYNWGALDASGNPAGDRDPMVLRIGSTFYMYFTSNNLSVGCATSTDLLNWTYRGPVLTQTGAALATNEAMESPFVVQNGDYFYLFTTHTNSASTAAEYQQTLVFRSKDPLDFGNFNGDQVHSPGSNFVTQLALHAPEVIFDPGANKWYVTTAGFGSANPVAAGDVKIAELQWQPETNDPIEPHDVPSVGLQTWLKFDSDGPNPAVDASGNGHDGSIYVRALPVSSPHNGALFFNRSYGGLVNLAPQSFSGDFSVGAWINMPETPSNADVIVGSATQDINFYNQYPRLYVDGFGDVVVSSVAVSPDTWTHVLVTRSSGTVRMYINGVLRSTGSWSGVFAPTAAGKGVTPFYLNGSLDDLVFYNRALTATEISQLAGGPDYALGASVTMSPDTSYEFEGWGKVMTTDGRRDSQYGLSEGVTTQAYSTATNTVDLVIQLPSNHSLSKIVLYGRNDDGWSGQGFPQDYTIDVWDGSAWSTKATVVGQGPPGNTGQAYNWSPVTANRVRIHATKLGAVPGYGYYLQLAEVELY